MDECNRKKNISNKETNKIFIKLNSTKRKIPQANKNKNPNSNELKKRSLKN